MSARALPTIRTRAKLGFARADRIFGAIGAGAAGAVVLVLAAVAISVTRIAWPSIAATGGAFVGATAWDPGRDVYGVLAFVWGTIITSVVALALAIPVGIGVAIFLTDLGPLPLRRWVSSAIELLAAIPSVVYGLWAALVLAPILRTWVEPVLEATTLPIFRGPSYGFDLLCASLVLAVMVLPTIAWVARDVLAVVPGELREGALALGATPWDVVRLVVLPHAKRGLFGAILLGFGRAIGETMAVAAVVGSRPAVSLSLLSPGYTMSSVIANEFPTATSELHVAALAEVGLSLLLLTLVLNVAARVLVARATGPAP